MKHSDNFHISAQNIDCDYSLELPCKNKKNNVYTFKTPVFLYKSGL